MRKIFITFSLLALLIVPSNVSASSVSSSSTLAERVAGRILLQTESHGEAWYVDPVNGGRYYLKDGETAYAMMRYFGLGISEVDFQLLSTRDKNLHDRLKGRIVIRVGYHGEAWYVHPDASRSLYYLQDGPSAYEMMRYLSMGVTDADLALIEEMTLTEPVLAEYAKEGEDQGIQYIPPYVKLAPTGWQSGTDRTPVPVSISVATTVNGNAYSAIGGNGSSNRSLAGLASISGTTAAVPFDLSSDSSLAVTLNVNNTTPDPAFYCYGFGNEFWYRSIEPVDQTVTLDLNDDFQHYFDVHFAGNNDARKSFQFRVHCANEYGTTYQDWVEVMVQP